MRKILDLNSSRFKVLDNNFNLRDVNKIRLNVGDIVTQNGLQVGVVAVGLFDEPIIFYFDRFGRLTCEYDELSQQFVDSKGFGRYGQWGNSLKFIPTQSLRIFAIDFDGTLYDKDTKFPEVMGGNWNLQLIDIIQKLQLNSLNRFILWSCRNESELKPAIDKLAQEFDLYFDAHNDNLTQVANRYGDNPRKIIADYYIDNSAGMLSSKAAAVVSSKYLSRNSPEIVSKFKVKF